MVTLKHDQRDRGRVFKKPAWDNTLMFSWCEPMGYYGYCEITKKGKIKFKKPHHESNRYAGFKVSKVGLGVLESNLIEVIYKEEKKMADVDFIGGKYNVVQVRVVESAGQTSNTMLYAFKIDADITVVEGDLLVVESGNGLGLVRVVEYHERNLEVDTMKIFNKAKAWVVAKVDESRQKQRREATQRREFIMKQLEEKKQAMEEVAIFKLLAESDPDAAKMLEELKQLGV